METAKFYSEGLSTDEPNWDQLFTNAWEAALSYLAPLIKNPGSRGEREIRIAKQFMPGDFESLVIRQKRTMMSRHIPLSLPEFRPESSKLLPIEEMMLGPGRHKVVTQVSVDALLRKYGYAPDVSVTLSTRPYQET